MLSPWCVLLPTRKGNSGVRQQLLLTCPVTHSLGWLSSAPPGQGDPNLHTVTWLSYVSSWGSEVFVRLPAHSAVSVTVAMGLSPLQILCASHTKAVSVLWGLFGGS